MLKKLLIVLVGLLLISGCQSKKEKETKKELVEFNALKTLTFDEVDKFYEEKKSGVLYFGWIENCGDSIHFQENYLEQKLIDNPELKENMYVVNLDKELPDALKDKALREPMKEKYDVGFSPTLLLVEDGVVKMKSEWQVKTSDPLTGIPASELDVFFNESGYIK